jgi:photosystem II stability/assembly factor-like uncharacterized protein
MNGSHDSRDPQEEPLPPNPDLETLALIEATIASTHGRGASAYGDATANGGPNSLTAFSARLAATMPSMDERFHDDLLARLLQELSEPEQAAAQEPALQSTSKAEAALAQATARQPQSLSHSRAHLTTFRIPNMGWVASAATALAGVAVLLLVIVGMLGIIRSRQGTNQTNTKIQANLTQTATAGRPFSSVNLLADLQLLHTLTGTGRIGWSADGRTLLTSGQSNTDMQIWDSATGNLLGRVKTGDGEIRAWAPGGRLLAVASGRTITLLDPTGRQTLRSWSAPEEVATLSWSPDGQTLATGTANLTVAVWLWDVATGKEKLSIGHVGGQDSVNVPVTAWPSDGKTLAIGEGINAADLRDPSTGKLLRSIGPNYSTRTWATLDLTPSPTPLPTPPYRDAAIVGPAGLAWSHDGRFLATSYSRVVTIWDASSGQALHTFGAPVPFDNGVVWDTEGWIGDLSWSPDDAVLAVANGSLTLWDTATGTLLRTLTGTVVAFGPRSGLRLADQVSWSPDGRYLAVGYPDGVEIWGAGSGSATPSVLTASPEASATQAAVLQDCGSWHIVPSAAGDKYSQLTGVAATSVDDAWAVGFHSDKPVSNYWIADALAGQDPVHSLIEHWDGSSWSIVPSPGAGGSSYLLGVAAVDKTHAWAVGYYTTTDNVQQTLIFGWNGAGWQLVPSPNVTGMNNRLIGVTAVGPDDVWAVGSSGVHPDFNSGPSQTLILHFDGKAWSIVPSPNPSAIDNHLTGISAASPDDVWAVGFQNPEEMKMGLLALHWDGREWKTVPLQTGAKVVPYALSGVAATHAGAWATGGWSDIGGGSWQVSRYDVDGRQGITSPDLRTGDVVDVYLTGVAARSPDSIWAVGSIARNKDSKVAPPDLPGHETLVLHWDGSNWSTTATPSVQGQDNRLSAIAPVPGANDGAMWAAGSSSSDGASTPLILRYGGCTASEPSASNTTKPAAPSSTGTPGSSASPSPIPTSPAVPLASVPACGLTWSLVPLPSSTPAGGTNPGPFTGIAAIASNDIWAVGYGSASPTRALAAHWDGSAWSMVPVPNTGTGDNKLYGVAAAGANDVWAVGSYGNSSTDAKPLVVHWDGSTWKVVSGGDPGPGAATLRAVTAVSPNDVWAVGTYTFSTDPGNTDPMADVWRSKTLIEHWDGNRWSIVSGPSPGTLNNTLSSLAVVSKDDIWAVGSYEVDQKQSPGTGKTLVLHWDGKAWSLVPSPDVQTWIDGLSGVAARSADDVWAVGWANNGEHVDPLTMHWDGNQWSIVPSPASISHNGGSPSAVAIVSANDVWAIGADNIAPFAMHWDGKAWLDTSVPTQTTDGKYLFGGLSGIAALAPADIWVVGGLGNGNGAGSDVTGFMMRYSNVPCAPPSHAIPTGTPTTATSSQSSTVTEMPPAKAPTGVPTSISGGIAGNTTLSAVSFIDANRGWLADAGFIFATTDGGQRWTKRHEAPGTVASLDFVSDSQGWLTTAASVYGTHDGGLSWQQLFYLKYASLYQIDFVDANNGWLTFISDDGNGTHGILHTTDGGKSWTAVSDPCGQGWRPGSFSFYSPNTGFMMCGGVPGAGNQEKQLFKTTDAGQTWQLVTEAQLDGVQSPNALSTAGYLGDLFFLDDLHGWSSVDLRGNGLLKATTDGGKTWEPVLISPAPGIPYNIRFVAPDIGFTIYDSRGGVEAGPTHLVLLGTRDGGASWKQLYPAIAPVGPVQYLDGRVGFGAATALDWGAILKTTDGGASWTQAGEINDLCGISKLSGSQCGGCQALISALDFADIQHGFANAKCFAATNPPDMRYETTDGGATWWVSPTK